VRVAARDRRSGRTGSQSQWVEIPNPTPGGISLSSIFIGELRLSSGDAAQRVSVNVSRRFALRFQTFVYSAGGSGDAADVALQVTIVRDGQTVLTLPRSGPSKNGSTDPARIPFSGEMSLAQLPAGRYVLQISARDRKTNSSASQEAGFIVE
jgi:hypothetical protein